MSSKATIKDVAKEAGCSPSLVSFYLRNPQTTRVAEQTKQRIAGAVEKLNYQRNLLASILKSGCSNVVGVLADAQANPPIFRLIASLEQEANVRNLRLQVGLFHDSLENLLEACSILKQYGPAGIICLSHDYPEFNRELDQKIREIPELIFYDGPQRSGHACVIPDKEFGVKLAVEHLKQSGRKRIALCVPGDCPDWDSVTRKIRSFTELSGSDSLLCRLPHALALRQAMRVFLMPFIREKQPDAILFSSDRFALCACGILRENNLRVPEDIAVIGCDNDPACREYCPAVSSVAFDQGLIARTLLDVLQKNSRAEVTFLRPELLLRESC